MVKTTQTIETLGSSGLLERLDEKTKNEGLLNYRLLVDLIKDKKYKRVQGIGDDFIPDDGLYNAVGAIYPLLDKKQRDETIRSYLTQFDRLNYLTVNLNHTPKIREPLLLTDIAIARPFYWPGLKDEKILWDGKESFSEIRKENMTENGLFNPNRVKNDFLVAYSLMRNDFTSFGEDYVKSANPKFLNRVMKGIVALRFAGVTTDSEIEKGRNRLYELLPKSVHDRIEFLRKEADWTNANQFR